MQKSNQLISKYFSIWTTAENTKRSSRGRKSPNNQNVYGVQKLKELILELAISGKITPKNNIEIEKNSILEDIGKENKDLNKKGILKKQKLLTVVNDHEKLFELPKNWEWIRLGNTGNIFNGNSINKTLKEDKYSNSDGRPFIATKDVGYGFSKINYENGVKIPLNEEKFKIAHKNAVLICSEGGSAGKKMGITEYDICFGNKLFANETYSVINPKYILCVYQSKTFHNLFSNRMTGIIGGISRNEFLNIPIPIPPLEEQNEIVNQVYELMSICNQLELQHINTELVQKKLTSTLLKNLYSSENQKNFKKNWQLLFKHFNKLIINEESIDEIKKTILQLAVSGKIVKQCPEEEPAINIIKKIELEKNKIDIKKKKKSHFFYDDIKKFHLPHGWEMVSISDLTLQITDGTHHTPKYVKKGVPFISIKDIDGDKISFDDCKYISEIEHNKLKERCNPELGDILICRIGTLGRATIVKTKTPFSLFVSVGLLKLPRSIKLTNYLHMALSSPLLHSQFDKIKAGGIHTDKLNLGDIPKLYIPLPPLEEQERIMAKLEELMSLCEKIKLKIYKSNITKKLIAETLVSKFLN